MVSVRKKALLEKVFVLRAMYSTWVYPINNEWNMLFWNFCLKRCVSSSILNETVRMDEASVDFGIICRV